MLPTWCQATGNLSMNMTKQVKSCHLPMAPIRSIGSSGFFPSGDADEAVGDGS